MLSRTDHDDTFVAITLRDIWFYLIGKPEALSGLFK